MLTRNHISIHLCSHCYVSRPEEELNKILSWNGVHAKLGTGQAPRGCLGYHLSIDIAKKVVSRFTRKDNEAGKYCFCLAFYLQRYKAVY